MDTRDPAVFLVRGSPTAARFLQAIEWHFILRNWAHWSPVHHPSGARRENCQFLVPGTALSVLLKGRSHVAMRAWSMAKEQWTPVIRYLRRLAAPRDTGDRTDGQLLERFT